MRMFRAVCNVEPFVSYSLTGQLRPFAQNLPHLYTGQHLFEGMNLILKPGLQDGGGGHLNLLHSERKNRGG